MEDLTGKRYGKLVAIKYVCKVQDNRNAWLCKCDCGNEKVISEHNLKRGNTTSCGCYGNLCRTERAKHRLVNKRVYRVWSNMKSRCSNPKATQYKWYGGRGISFASEWSDFTCFYNWAMNNGYSDDLELDRKDNEKDYSPSNCRFVTHKENCNNRRSNRKRG